MTGESEAANADLSIRLADREDLPQVMNVLDGSLLDVAAERVRERIDAGSVLVATERASPLGVLVLSKTEIEAIASDADTEIGASRVRSSNERGTRRPAH